MLTIDKHVHSRTVCMLLDVYVYECVDSGKVKDKQFLWKSKTYVWFVR